MEKEKTSAKRKSPFTDIFLKLIDGMTQQQVADKVGVSRQNVGFWIKGTTVPDIFTLSKIADAFNVSTDYLLGRTERKLNDKKGEFVNEVLDKQIRLLSETSEVCAANSDLFQELPKMTQALNAVIAAKDIHNGRTSYTYGFGCSNID